MMRPFLLLATRADDPVADAEYQAFLRFGGLSEGQLVRVRLEQGPLDELMPGLDLRDYSGVILGGSPFTSTDPPREKSPAQVRVEAELEGLVGDVLKFDVPFLGACYGISTLGRFLGGRLDRTYAEPVAAVPVTLTVEGAADPLLAGLPRTFRAFVGHKEALRAVPPGAVLLASSPGCPVQMFQVGEHQYATQFHPELDVPGIIERIRVYRHCGYFHPDEMDTLIGEVSVAEVPWPARILANFTARYASP
ncbi:MAG TPA: glutamine amidotransferase [Actinoplanes sp.]|nr:glutamine amidotransferase [Actinoplanes sp.]